MICSNLERNRSLLFGLLLLTVTPYAFAWPPLDHKQAPVKELIPEFAPGSSEDLKWRLLLLEKYALPSASPGRADSKHQMEQGTKLLRTPHYKENSVPISTEVRNWKIKSPEGYTVQRTYLNEMDQNAFLKSLYDHTGELERDEKLHSTEFGTLLDEKIQSLLHASLPPHIGLSAKLAPWLDLYSIVHAHGLEATSRFDLSQAIQHINPLAETPREELLEKLNRLSPAHKAVFETHSTFWETHLKRESVPQRGSIALEEVPPSIALTLEYPGRAQSLDRNEKTFLVRDEQGSALGSFQATVVTYGGGSALFVSPLRRTDLPLGLFYQAVEGLHQRQDFGPILQSPLTFEGAPHTVGLQNTKFQPESKSNMRTRLMCGTEEWMQKQEDHELQTARPWGRLPPDREPPPVLQIQVGRTQSQLPSELIASLTPEHARKILIHLLDRAPGSNTDLLASLRANSEFSTFLGVHPRVWTQIESLHSHSLKPGTTPTQFRQQAKLLAAELKLPFEAIQKTRSYVEGLAGTALAFDKQNREETAKEILPLLKSTGPLTTLNPELLKKLRKTEHYQSYRANELSGLSSQPAWESLRHLIYDLRDSHESTAQALLGFLKTHSLSDKAESIQTLMELCQLASQEPLQHWAQVVSELDRHLEDFTQQILRARALPKQFAFLDLTPFPKTASSLSQNLEQFLPILNRQVDAHVLFESLSTAFAATPKSKMLSEENRNTLERIASQAIREENGNCYRIYLGASRLVSAEALNSLHAAIQDRIHSGQCFDLLETHPRNPQEVLKVLSLLHSPSVSLEQIFALKNQAAENRHLSTEVIHGFGKLISAHLEHKDPPAQITPEILKHFIPDPEHPNRFRLFENEAQVLMKAFPKAAKRITSLAEWNLWAKLLLLHPSKAPGQNRALLDPLSRSLEASLHSLQASPPEESESDPNVLTHAIELLELYPELKSKLPRATTRLLVKSAVHSLRNLMPTDLKAEMFFTLARAVNSDPDDPKRDSHLKKLGERILDYSESKGLSDPDRTRLLSWLRTGTSSETPLKPIRKPYAVLFNGGYDPFSNRPSFEEDMAALDHTLFGGKALLLNAGGKNTMLSASIAHESLRDPVGRKILLPSQVRSDLDASSQNLERVLTSLQKETHPNLLFYFGDHGGKTGLATWHPNDGELLDYSKLRQLLRALPASSTVQAIHDHCFSGQALADPKRTPPSLPSSPNAPDFPAFREGLAKYLHAQFPENSCGIATAPDDQSAVDSDWIREALKSGKEVTLDLLKQMAIEHSRTTPSLTSDAILEDFHSMLCRTPTTPKEGVPNSPSCKKRSEVLPHQKTDALYSVLNFDLDQTLCAHDLRMEIEGLKAQQVLADELSSDYDALKGACTREFLKKEFPWLEQARKKFYRELEVLKTQLAVAHDPAAKSKIEGQIQQIWTRDRLDQARWRERIRELPQAASPECLLKKLQKKPDHYPALTKLAEGSSIHSDSFWVEANKKMLTFDLLSKRKEKEIQLQELRKKEIEPWLKQNLPGAWEHYEKIRKCETIPIH